MRARLLIVFVLGFFGLQAQPDNNTCSTAEEIANIQNYCSGPEAFTNQGSSATGTDCFSNNSGDVWFAFTSISTSVNIRVLGDVVDAFRLGAWSQGTMVNPRLALYRGDCSALTEVDCADQSRSNIGEIFLDDITPNTRYFLKVSAARAGTFQLCISSFNLIPAPQNDCAEAVVLCSKESFYAPFLQGGGVDPDEVDNTCLDRYNDGGTAAVNAENATAWYKWVIRNTGDLTFVLTPNNPSDDLDFALIRLNGLDDCNTSNVVRCMASGANFSTGPFGSTLDDLNTWIDCHGPTGLLNNDQDVFEERAGCQSGNNNFVRSVPVVEGEVYALVIDNFSNSRHGFSLTFGGSAEFIAPDPDFEIEDSILCLGQEVQLTDSSRGTTNLMWVFGDGATPETSSGNRQPMVSYDTPGEKTISLIVEGTTGCLTTLQKTVEVLEAIIIDSMIRPQSCPEIANGQITVIDPGGGPAISSVTWSTGDVGFTLDALAAGPYMATVMNAESCTESFSFRVPEPAGMVILPTVIESTCGNSNGSISLDITGQAGPFEVDFGSGFVSDQSMDNLPADLYPTVVRDAGGCLDTLLLAISDQDLQIVTDFTPPSCYGFANGTASVNVLEGTQPVQFDWNLDMQFGDNATLVGLTAGVVSVEVRDNQQCRRFESIEIMQPDSLDLTIDTTHISCFGFDDGVLATDLVGGTGMYRYTWSNGSTDADATGLSPGEYQLTVRDENQCEVTAAGQIIEPPPIGVSIGSFADVVCFGDETGEIEVLPTGGSPPYQFSLDGIAYQSPALFSGLGAGSYVLTLRDANGCIDTVSQDIDQPEQILLQAEGDTTIRLGFTTELSSMFTPDQSVTYEWSDPQFLDCPTCGETTAFPTRNTLFTLTVTNDLGCTAQDAVLVNVILDRPVYIPNAITPNGDGRNDQFTIFAGPAAVAASRVQIFDRWGEKVYDGSDLPLNNPTGGWDGRFRGKPLNPGVFAYLVEVLFVDAQTVTFTGDINLIR
ncbi:MAG: gliding motility-associated C-terminal domain-containing protein [Saprospiraceae bacterium]|nr:gliding motility-associated C-terminal domain-containing protein [Saprospiraceae bacterium]